MKPILRRALLGLAGFGLLIAFFYAEEDLRGWYAWNSFKHQWAAKGEKFDPADIVPPSVPDDQNFAMSPVWIAEISYVWRDSPKRAEDWYGNRMDDEEVTRLTPRIPVQVSGLVGTNGDSQQLPATPDVSSLWTIAQATDLTPWQSYYRNLQRSNPAADIPTAAQPQSPAADVLLALSKYDPVIEKLRQDSALPDSRFPVIYGIEDPAEILLPHLAIVKRYAQVLQLCAVAELQSGQNEKAFEDVKLMLRLTDSIRSEPFIISHLVQIAILNLALQPVWEGMDQHQWTDAQLAALDAELAGQDFLADYQLSMRGEMGFQGGIIDYLRRHPDKYAEIAGNGNDVKLSLLTRISGYLTPSGWYYQNRLRCARAMVEWYIPLADTNLTIISPKATHRADVAVQAGLRHPNHSNYIESMLLPGLGNLARRYAYGQEMADLARVSIALERYRHANGEYPGSLDVLEPRYLEQVPHDIINGDPLHYDNLSYGKFQLYSVGWNEKDDNGKVAASKSGVVNLAAGDWVWKN